MRPQFSIQGDQFFLNETPFQIVGGAIHYFRVHPDYWRDRLTKLKACGLNTLETYVAWNVHEPEPGRFRFSGWQDLAAYINLADELGLHVIIRPGAYICSEWELGGLPSWLLRDPAMRLRTRYQPFLDAVGRYFDQLMPILVPLQTTNGGPIIAMQVENEYGYQGNDSEYMATCERFLTDRGVDVPLFTSDPVEKHLFPSGRAPHALMTGNFGSGPKERFKQMRSIMPKGPLMCGEFWNGWFDHWGEEHHSRDGQDVADTLAEILDLGGSANFYMFHGGTNFGFQNGANEFETYMPTVTSYDFDAPLNEAGDVTPKFKAIQQVLAERFGKSTVPLPPDSIKRAYGTLELTQAAPLVENLSSLSNPIESPYPLGMEEVEQHTGFMLYRTHVSGPREIAPLRINGLKDRALVYLGGVFQGTLDRTRPDDAIEFAIPPEGSQLDILVENQGRNNHGMYLHDRKGILDQVYLCSQALHNWTQYPLPLTDVTGLDFMPRDSMPVQDGPVFYAGILEVEEVGDTFLALPGWTKGVAFLNGFNLGRYWEVGPQQTLYIPAPLLKRGSNQLVILELYGTAPGQVEFRNAPDLG